MPLDEVVTTADQQAINRAFSKQSAGYDTADEKSIILQDLRHQVYRHVERFLQPQSRLLELNAGTGIDAMYFVSSGHRVHATDVSDGMINQIQKKISIHSLSDRLSCQQVSYADLDQVAEEPFDYVFSNFGGLNCIRDLSMVTKNLGKLVKQGGYVTWVIMPPICPWELMWLIKGKMKQAFRRLAKGGVMAHVEGEYLRTYYHSLKQVRSAFGDAFRLIRVEGLAALSPPPHASEFPIKHPATYKLLRNIDGAACNTFPFNRWADHLIVTFQFK